MQFRVCRAAAVGWAILRIYLVYHTYVHARSTRTYDGGDLFGNIFYSLHFFLLLFPHRVLAFLIGYRSRYHATTAVFASSIAPLARHELRRAVCHAAAIVVRARTTQDLSCCCCCCGLYLLTSIFYVRVTKHFISRHPTMCGINFNADHSFVNSISSERRISWGK